MDVRAGEAVRTRGSMNGLLHSLSPTRPPDALVAPLAPRLWRSDLKRASLERAVALGARYQLVLSDVWGYPQDGWSRGPPWADLSKWERFVRRTARAHRGKVLMWDVWNEPDVKDFWSGGRRRLIRTYVTAARALREELGPRAVIGGPSISRFSMSYLRDLLEACVRARCPVSFISWHENLRTDQPIAAGAQRMMWARRELLGNPRYRRLGLREIHINEYVGVDDRFLPGELVAYLAALERGGADLAARSCWTDEECSPAGVGGLVEAASGMRRAVWWVHRWYAEGAAGRVRSDSSNPSIATLARAIPGRVEALIGNAPVRGPGAPAAKSLRIALALSDLGRVLGTRGRARVTIYRVRPSGGRGLDGPDRLRDLDVTLDGRPLELRLPPLRPHEAMRVVLDRR